MRFCWLGFKAEWGTWKVWWTRCPEIVCCLLTHQLLPWTRLVHPGPPWTRLVTFQLVIRLPILPSSSLGRQFSKEDSTPAALASPGNLLEKQILWGCRCVALAALGMAPQSVSQALQVMHPENSRPWTCFQGGLVYLCWRFLLLWETPGHSYLNCSTVKGRVWSQAALGSRAVEKTRYNFEWKKSLSVLLSKRRPNSAYQSECS